VVPAAFLAAERRLHHQTIPPMTTAARRMPKAIQPHCVELLEASLLFEAAAAAAAAAAGVTPEVVVGAVVTTVTAGATVVWV
jgi:hypothetical protein